MNKPLYFTYTRTTNDVVRHLYKQKVKLRLTCTDCVMHSISKEDVKKSQKSAWGDFLVANFIEIHNYRKVAELRAVRFITRGREFNF